MRTVMKMMTQTQTIRREKPSTSRLLLFFPSNCDLCFWTLPSNSGEHTKGGENGDGGDGDDHEDEDEDDEDDEEDETAELFRELEKIKRERAAEKERVDQAEAAVTEAEREAQIATANPLLNLAAALGNAPGINTTAPGTFAVKRRWDDGALPMWWSTFADLNERLPFSLQTSFSRTRRQVTRIMTGRVSLSMTFFGRSSISKFHHHSSSSIRGSLPFGTA